MPLLLVVLVLIFASGAFVVKKLLVKTPPPPRAAPLPPRVLRRAGSQALQAEKGESSAASWVGGGGAAGRAVPETLARWWLARVCVSAPRPLNCFARFWFFRPQCPLSDGPRWRVCCAQRPSSPRRSPRRSRRPRRSSNGAPSPGPSALTASPVLLHPSRFGLHTLPSFPLHTNRAYAAVARASDGRGLRCLDRASAVRAWAACLRCARARTT
jgi:hypothetical protein